MSHLDDTRQLTVLVILGNSHPELAQIVADRLAASP